MYNIGLKVKATEKTPLLEYIPRESVFNMKGVSVPDDANKFYDPILNWLSGYVELNQIDPITVNIDLEYFSIQSSTILLKILKHFSKLPKVTVNWYYEDSDIKEIGEDFSYIVGIKFNFLSKESNEL